MFKGQVSIFSRSPGSFFFLIWVLIPRKVSPVFMVKLSICVTKCYPLLSINVVQGYILVWRNRQLLQRSNWAPFTKAKLITLWSAFVEDSHLDFPWCPKALLRDCSHWSLVARSAEHCICPASETLHSLSINMEKFEVTKAENLIIVSLCSWAPLFLQTSLNSNVTCTIPSHCTYWKALTIPGDNRSKSEWMLEGFTFRLFTHHCAQVLKNSTYTW